MKNVEALGLLKMDFLGLRNLDVIDKAVGLIGDGLDIGAIPIDDAQDVRDAGPGGFGGCLPVRVVRDARCAAPGEADRVRGPDRARRPVSAGPDAVHPELRGAEERPRGRHVHRRAAEADHERLAGDLHLPGAIHADRQADGRLLPCRGRDAETGDRQEDPRADGLAEGEVPGRLRGERRHPVGREPALEGHGAVAGLLVQQGPLRMLCVDRLSNCLAEGELPVRIHGGADLVRDEHEGSGPAVRERVRRDGDRGAPARRERVGHRFRGRGRQDPLRPQRGQERRRQRSAGDHRRAQAGWLVRDDLGLHRARRSAGRQQAGARVARQVRRPRLHRRLADGDARSAGAGARVRAEARGRSARRTGIDLRSGLRRRRAGRGGRPQAPSPDRRERVREGRAPAAREGDPRPLRLGAPAQRRSRPAASQDRCDARASSSAGATARS